MGKFKEGDKIVCIAFSDPKNPKIFSRSLEYGKTYTCELYYGQDFYKDKKNKEVCITVNVKGDNGKILKKAHQFKYPETLFVSLVEFRKEKLKKLNNGSSN